MSSKKWWEDGYNEKEHAKDLASVGQASQEQVQMLEKEEEEQDSTQYPRIQQQQQQQHKTFKLEEEKDKLAEKIVKTMGTDTCRIKLEAVRDFIDIILRSEP